MKWLRNLKVQFKLFLVFGVFIILMFLFIFATSRQLMGMNDTFGRAVQRQTNISEAINTLSLLRLNNFTTSALYYNDKLSAIASTMHEMDYEGLSESFIAKLEENKENVNQDTILSREEKRVRMEILNRTLELFEQSFEPSFYLIRQGIESGDEEMMLAGLQQSDVASDQLLENLNTVYGIATSYYLERANDFGGSAQNIIILLLVFAFGILIVCILMSIFMRNTIVGPIVNMEQAMAEISAGNLTYPIRSENKDEMGILSNRIGDMVDGISEMNKAVTSIDYLDTMILVTDLDYNMVYINRSMAEAFGIDPENYKMKKCYHLLRGLDQICENCHLQELLEKDNQDSYPTFEFKDVWDEDLQKWTGGRVSVIRWVDGNLVYYQTMNDETKNKEYEEILQKSVREAEAASVSKSVFLANMSHEIRTPMNSIIGFSELAMDDKISENTKKYLEKIIENSNWLLQIINDILDVSKVESGRMELERIPFDLHELLTTCRTTILPKSMEKGINLYFYAEPSIGKRLLGDPTRLRQVLLNILSNAVKFTHAAGTVKVAATVEGQPNGNITIKFEIKDNGIGMTPEQLKRIAEPFVQGDTGIARKYGGTGLGLTISKSIVELMGGELLIESTSGVGSKFSFTVSFDTVEALEREEEIHIMDDVEKPLFKGNVLLCEDNQMNQQVISEHLERVGLTPTIAENGKEGVDFVKQRIRRGDSPFDLIFMDIHMPVMDGLEATAKILELDTGTPIVALTANIMAHDRGLYLENGMKDCLGKPFVSKDLWRCLLKFLTPIQWKEGNSEEEVQAEDALRQRIIRSFVEGNEHRYQEIVETIDRGDIVLAHRMAHTLKSNAASIEKESLRRIAERMEGFLKDGVNRTTKEELSQLNTELECVLAELRPVVAQMDEKKEKGPVKAQSALDSKEIEEVFVALEPLLERGNPDSMKLVSRLKQIPGSEELVRNIEDLDFELAGESLVKLRESFMQKKPELWA